MANRLLELFGKSAPIPKKPKRRFALDENGNVHRFAYTNNGSWHWNGSTGQIDRPNLTSE